MIYRDIDFNELWQEARCQKSWSGKKRADWNKKAKSFAKRAAHSEYADIFVKRMDPAPEWTVLDVGAGPGTLTLPLARRVKKVTACLSSLTGRCCLQLVHNTVNTFSESIDSEFI